MLWIPAAPVGFDDDELGDGVLLPLGTGLEVAFSATHAPNPVLGNQAPSMHSSLVVQLYR